MKRLNENIGQARVLTIIQAILLIILGIIFLRNPISSLVTMGVFLATIAIISGIVGIIRYFSSSYFTSGAFLIASILEIIVGIILFRYMPYSTLTLGIILGFGILFSSISQIAISLDLKNSGFSSTWINIISAILGIIVGFMLISNPSLTPIYVGIYFLVLGISYVFLFFSLGSLQDKTE